MTFYHCLLLFALYFSQYLPIAFAFFALPAILRVEGASLEEISWIYLIGIVWVFKFLWAPCVDRYSFGRLGHYKMWLMVTQYALAIVTLLFSFLGSADRFTIMMALGLSAAFIAATQDIAADAIACRLVPAQQRGRASAIQLSGALLAKIVGGGVVLILFEHIGWQACLLAISLLVASVIIITARFNEQDIAISDNTKSALPRFMRLFSFWLQPGMGMWAAILIVLPASITMVRALISPILVDQGWSADSVGILLCVVAPIVSMAVPGLFSALLKRFNKWYVLATLPILQIATLLLVYYCLHHPANEAGLVISLLAVYAVGVALFVILVSFMLGYSGRGTEGSDFTVQNSFQAFFAFALAGAGSYFAGSVGYAVLVTIAGGIALAGGAFLYAVILLKRKQNALTQARI